jgi:hypothetical protein
MYVCVFAGISLHELHVGIAGRFVGVVLSRYHAYRRAGSGILANVQSCSTPFPKNMTWKVVWSSARGFICFISVFWSRHLLSPVTVAVVAGSES